MISDTNHNEKIRIFAGSMDPITKGHESVIKVASELVDKLYVVVANNPDKSKYYFSLGDRLNMCNLVTSKYQNVVTTATYDLISDFAKQVNATILFRGLRYVSEYEYELDMAFHNNIIGGIKTVGVFPNNLHVSSSAVRLLISHKKDNWKDFVDEKVSNYIIERYY